jgi:predicted  nucleic acid-binding Zn-ribbon protein
MQAIISYPEKQEQIQALKAFLTALKIKFEDKEEIFDLDSKIKQAREEKNNGELKQVNAKNIWATIS